MALSTQLVRKIGDALVPAVGFGAMGMSFGYGTTESDEERFKLLDAAYEQGCLHWDTANVYGDSEEVIGKWFKRTGKRNDIFLATKFGYSPQGARGDPAYVKEQCYKSLERLGVDCIDLYYLHRIDPKTPIETTITAMVNLIKEGKVKYLGLSECGVKDLRRAHAVHPISALQMEYSPLWLNIERSGIFATAKELGVTIVAYSPLAKGLISGQYKSPDDFEESDFRRNVPRYSKENFPKILKAVERIKEIGSAHNATPGQISLAWILAQGENIVVIPGTKKIKYLNENLGAANVKLSSEEITSLRKICEESEKDVVGPRYTEVYQKLVDAESPPLKV